MEVISNVDQDQGETAIRAAFEQMRDDRRKIMISSAIDTVAMSYKAASVGGPIALAITIPLGMLKMFWSLKDYRSKAYQEMEALGLIRRPSTRIRSALARQAGWRYPHGELVADVIVDVLSKANPLLTEAQLKAAGLNALRSLREFRHDYPDVPIEIAADVILASHGIFRKPESLEYEHIPQMETQVHIVHHQIPEGEVEAPGKYLIYALIPLFLILILRR